METTRGHHSENGQAVVLLVLAMVVLLGFTALAVDGSMVYSDRRYAQNAADASSLAGGSVAAKQLEAMGVTYQNWTASPPNCTGKVGQAGKAGRDSAVKRAKDNSFTIDQNIVDNMGVISECGIEPLYYIPTSGPAVKFFDDKYMDIRTMITSQTQTAFAHFVYRGPMVNTVSAVTRIRPRQPLAYGFAVVSLNKDISNCNANTGMNFNGLGGSGNLTVNGSGIWSNGCMDTDGQVSVTINGPANYFGTANNNALGKITLNTGTPPTQMSGDPSNYIPPEMYDIPMPNCSGHEVTSNFIVKYGDTHKDPITNQPEPLPAGLYCVTDDLRINAGEKVAGYGVTLVLYEGMHVNGSPDIKLTAPPSNYVGPALPGVLIYANKVNTSSIIINGNEQSWLQGTILAPGASINVSGNSSMIAKSQIIGYNVSVGGSSGTTVTYNANDQTSKPTSIELYR